MGGGCCPLVFEFYVFNRNDRLFLVFSGLRGFKLLWGSFCLLGFRDDITFFISYKVLMTDTPNNAARGVGVWGNSYSYVAGTKCTRQERKRARDVYEVHFGENRLPQTHQTTVQIFASSMP